MILFPIGILVLATALFGWVGLGVTLAVFGLMAATEEL